MIAVVFVAFNPDAALLEKAIESLLNQVNFVIIVDNSPVSYLKFENEKVSIKILGENVGIAAAQNIGIAKSIELGAQYIVLSDQDSIYPENYIVSMLPVFDDFPSACAVVPKFVDTNKKGQDGFISINSFFFRRFFPIAGRHQVLQAIASGKILKASTLGAIGLMNEELFIDWVDIEWCWRARSSGFQIIGNADVVIHHQLGDCAKNLVFREVNLRSPIRHYYITRNAFYLALHCECLDVGHRINLFIKSFRYIFAYPILSKPRLLHLNAVLKGFLHGTTGKLGRQDWL
jgi:rhamnosyltransferase